MNQMHCRIVALIVLAAFSTGAEEVFQLKDGRQLVGVYDAAAQTIEIAAGKSRAVVPLRADDIASRRPAGDEPESEEVQRIRWQRELDQEEAAKRAAEAKRQIDAAEAEQHRRDGERSERLRADARIQYWAAQKVYFPTDGLTAEQIDDRGSNYARAAYWKEHDHEFDASTMTAAQMNQEVEAEVERQAMIDRAKNRAIYEAQERERRADAAAAESARRFAAKKADDAKRKHEEDEERASDLRWRTRLDEMAREAADAERHKKNMILLQAIAELVAFLMVFPIPSVIAKRRRHRNRVAIWVMSGALLLIGIPGGFIDSGVIATSIVRATAVIGWMACLGWSLIRTDYDENASVRAS